RPLLMRRTGAHRWSSYGRVNFPTRAGLTASVAGRLSHSSRPRRARRAVERGQGDPGRRGAEELRRVLRLAVDPVAEMHEVGPVAGARRAGEPDDVAAADGGAGADGHPAQVGVGGTAVTLVLVPDGSGSAHPAGEGHDAVAGGP